jgi:hypothetical protein
VTAPQLESIIQAATATLADWNSFVDELSSLEGPNQVVFDLEKSIPSLSPSTTIEKIGAKLAGAISLVHNLSGIESLDLIPDAIVTEVTARVSAVRAGVEKLRAQISSLENDSEIVSLDASNMIAANQKNQQVNLPPIFIELYPAIQSCLTSLYQIRTMSKLNEEGGYTLQLSQINAARSAQHRAYGDLNRLRRALDGNRKKLAGIIAEAQSAAQEVMAVTSQTTEAVKKAEESKGKAEVLLASTNAINDSAGKLKESIDAYQDKFNKFQVGLDERSATFLKGKTDLERLLADGKAEQDKLLVDKKTAHEHLLSEKSAAHEKLLSDIAVAQTEMDRLLARSREVLGEATVSGLSESFAREMRATGKQLRWIQVLFYFSVACLLAAAGIVLNAFPWSERFVHIVRFEPPANAEPIAVAVFYLGNFVSKLTFLLPPLILLIFAGRRYTEVFRLKTQYTYKYAVAASLPGFKIEAPNYADAITVLAFKELLFNPGEKVGAPEDKSDNTDGSTFIQRLIEPIVKKAMDKMGDVAKPPAVRG